MKIRTLTLMACVALIFGSVAMAADLGKSSVYYGSGPRSAAAHFPLGDGDCITQSADNTSLVAGTVQCSAGGITTDNSTIRVYDLDGDHGIAGDFAVGEVQYGVETAAGNTPLTISIYAIPNGSDISITGLPGALCSTNVVQADGDLLFESVAIAGCPPVNGSTSDLVVEVLSADCLESGACLAFFPGSNGAGEIGDSYIAADDCGIINPVPLSAIGFPGIHFVLDVCGAGEPPQPVPAVGALGALFTILALGAGSGYIVRRRREA